MDTSETYIKMCDCVEIQEGWEIKYGDWFTVCWTEGGLHIDGDWIQPSLTDETTLEKFDGGYEYDMDTLPKPYIWLPRQDQLQEMVGFGGDLIGGQVLLLMEYVRSLDDKYQFISWEQLWLAFVMKEKFGKVRNGSEWVAKVSL